MPTIQANSVGERVAQGGNVLEAAKTTTIAPVRKRYQLFVKVHRGYATANTAVERALEAVHEQQHTVADLLVAQNAAIDHLATTLAGDGLPRANPFKPLGFDAPSELTHQNNVDASKTCIRLAAAATKRKGSGAATKRAAAALDRAAKAVIAADKPIESLMKAHHDAIARRDALGQPWSNAFAALKHAARTAEDDGHRGLYAALFVRVKARPRKKPVKKGGNGGGGTGGGGGAT